MTRGAMSRPQAVLTWNAACKSCCCLRFASTARALELWMLFGPFMGRCVAKFLHIFTVGQVNYQEGMSSATCVQANFDEVDEWER